jgi:hypothetical protein
MHLEWNVGVILPRGECTEGCQEALLHPGDLSGARPFMGLVL